MKRNFTQRKNFMTVFFMLVNLFNIGQMFRALTFSGNTAHFNTAKCIAAAANS